MCAVCAGAMLAAAAGATDWGLWYGNGAGKPPSGEDSVQTLAQYGAYYMGDPDSKTLYLTFDCGYENGNTAKILDVLKAHHVPAAFFMVGGFLDAAPALARRMGDEGHLVGNHTAGHPNMTQVSKTRFTQELDSLAAQYRQVTGRAIDPFYRPPEGSYTYDNLKWAQEMGYHTTLWSVAYADWDQDKQPTRAAALQTLGSRVHPGAIILLHAVSSTNAAILDELLTGWEQQGYTFAYLTALPGLQDPPETAKPSACTFLVHGAAAPLTAYLIGGENYVRLRDFAAALPAGAGFGIAYDPDTATVELTRGQVYTPGSGELSGPADVAAMPAYPARQTILLDGASCALHAYEIAGSHYVRLRDLAGLTGDAVAYDPALQAVQIG